eukprot:3899768-Rhodomonas_salina.1
MKVVMSLHHPDCWQGWTRGWGLSLHLREYLCCPVFVRKQTARAAGRAHLGMCSVIMTAATAALVPIMAVMAVLA